MEPWQHFFFVKEIQKGSVSPTRPSATPTSCTWIGHANADRARFFQVRALVEHISPRSTTCLHKTEPERKRTRSILQTSSFSKERMRESETERESASMTGESSRARFGWPHFIGECNLPSQSSTELEQKRLKNAIFLSTAFSSSKERLWEGFNDGRELSKKFKYITSLGLEIIGFYNLAYNPRPAASGCIVLGVKPDNFSASACNNYINTKNYWK